jgi:hypothetical protein
MAKSKSNDHAKKQCVMELEEFVRTALQSIIRGMKNLGEEGYKAEGLPIGGQEARIDFKLSLETMKDGKIYVAKIDGKASPSSNRIEFSVKVGTVRSAPSIVVFGPGPGGSVPQK